MSTVDGYAKSMDPTPRMLKRSGPFAAEESLKTVAEAVAYCEQRGLDPSEVKLAHNYLIWEATETPDEVQRRIRHAEESRQRHLDAIRDMHAEYVERGLLVPTTHPPTPHGEALRAGEVGK